ncbi:MAG TPA: hypothetical protein VHI13_22195 [Candidatus Kapabacteria bacterium]|nr:hypothetical protein [Candidatus Kapabacteria bacterium]
MRAHPRIVAVHALLFLACWLGIRYFHTGGDGIVFLCYPIAAGLFAGFFCAPRWGFSVGTGNMVMIAQGIGIVAMNAHEHATHPELSHCDMTFLAVMICTPIGMALLSAIAAVARGLRWIGDRLYLAYAAQQRS